MPLINSKLELKLSCTKYYVLSEAGTENADGNDDDNNTVFNVKDTKLYVPVVTLSTRDIQKLSKFFSKGFERSVDWNEYKTKSD